jgi:thymidylate kinase
MQASFAPGPHRMDIGSLVVFEGPDGAGKSSTAARFTEYLTGSGSHARLFSFPGQVEGTLGWHVYQLHHNPRQFGIESLTAESLQTLHVAAHLDTIDQIIKPSLRSGTTIVLDRYWWSAWVYGRERHATPSTQSSTRSKYTGARHNPRCYF